MIFSSLGSSYSFAFAIKFLVARGRQADKKRLRRALQQRYGGRVQLYYRGRGALHEAIRLTQAKAVLANSFSCYAVEQAVTAGEAAVIFHDIDQTTFNLDLKTLKAHHKAHPQLQAVIVQNTFGIGCAIKPIAAYCKQQKLYLIEDLAHSVSGHYQDGSAFGSVGDLVILSFGRDKEIDVVNGGALIVRHAKLQAKMQAPQPLRGHWRQRLADRWYPWLTAILKACYVCPPCGRACHYLFDQLKLIIPSSDGPLFTGCELPAYRCQFVVQQLANLATVQQQRRKLSAVYDQLTEQQLTTDQYTLIRYPVVLKDAIVRQLLLAELKKHGFFLDYIWYDSLVYPARFQSASAYEQGSCPVKESLCQTIINLPLHQQVSVKDARKLAKIVAQYSNLRVKTDFTPAQWRQARDKFDEKTLNLLTGYEQLEASRADGHRVWRFGLYRNNRVVALMTPILVEARRGRFLKLAGNPLFDPSDQFVFGLLLNHLQGLARQHRCAFIRLQPFLDDTSAHRRFMKDFQLVLSPTNLNAEHTLKVDLTQAEQDILADSAFKKTRYQIKRAQRNQLQVIVDSSLASSENFLKLLKQTQDRQGFLSPPFDYMRHQFDAYRQSGNLHVYQVLAAGAELNATEPLAGACMLDSGSERAYLYGASSPEGQKLLAPYLLQWQAILDAKALGLKTHNLWGVSPPEADSKHRFYGLTHFKKGFSRQRFAYLPTHDLILNKLHYWLLYLFEKYEAKKRHLI